MKLDVAKQINRDFDNFAWETLESHIADRISSLSVVLETAKGEEVLKTQGAIAELRYFLRLKEHTKSVLDQSRKNHG